MPELPEVETIKRGLQKKIKNKKIKEVKILRSKSFIGNPKKIISASIKSINRRAKIFIINLDNNLYLLIHLKMSGQLVFQNKKTALKKDKTLDKYTRVIIDFNDDSRLLFNDLRVFGWIKVINQKQLEKELVKFGPEPFSKEFTPTYLAKILNSSRRAVKLVLMDQQKLAGVGNIYTNEALFIAGILPQRPANKATEKEINKLHGAIVKVLKQGVKYKGSSAADDRYIQPDGSKGAYQEHFQVYQKQGQKCRRCQTLIKRFKLGGRGTFYCPKCQQ